MNTNVYQELKQTIHFTNRSGVRATCPDCHVPHEWTDKIAARCRHPRKSGVRSSARSNARQVRRDAAGAAEHEWARLKANNSLECRNCHSAESMDITKQGARAAPVHQRFCSPGERTCIDCHKGIAHQLPNMEGVPPGWDEVEFGH